MKKIEVVDLLEHLLRIYPNKFEVDQTMVDAWYFHLKNHNKDAVMDNLLQFARNNRFPPTIADLVYKGNSLTGLDYHTIYGNGED